NSLQLCFLTGDRGAVILCSILFTCLLLPSSNTALRKQSDIGYFVSFLLFCLPSSVNFTMSIRRLEVESRSKLKSYAKTAKLTCQNLVNETKPGQGLHYSQGKKHSFGEEAYTKMIHRQIQDQSISSCHESRGHLFHHCSHVWWYITERKPRVRKKKDRRLM
ncbi:unnamed protein product, partial [Gulo gulo]